MTCLDTSILIDYMTGNTKIVGLVDEYASKEMTSITTITEYELLKHGDKIKREIAEGVIDSMQVYPFTSSSALEAAKIFERLRKSGRMINENDILIAGIAFSNNELLITRDKRFKGLEGIGRILIV